MVELIVRGAKLVTPTGVLEAQLAVQGGRVAAIEREIAEASQQEIDAQGLYLFPGLIDMHVHFNEPGRTEWEGMATGSTALAAGGGTLYADMPLNSHPPLLTAEAFHTKKAAAEAASRTDFALWGGLTPDNLAHLPELADCGVIGFKAFMSNSGIAEFQAADDLTLLEGMQRAAELGLPVAVHAESDALTSQLSANIRRQGGRSVSDYLASRPVVAELEAISRAILFAEETGCALHIVHVSTARGVALVSDAKARGVKVSCETCPHYLHFTGTDMERLGAALKCAPPLRSENQRAALWQALLRGEIDLIASDHSPAPSELKQDDDFFQVWGGINGVQASLHVLLAGAFEHGLPLAKIASLTATSPAACFGLARKGRLEPGFDADFTLVDLNAQTSFTKSNWHARHKLSPYLGQALPGTIQHTFLRGQEIFRDGTAVGPAQGRLVKPARWKGRGQEFE